MLLSKDILLFVVSVAVTESLATDKETNVGTQKYCGRNLVNVLTIICDGMYNNQLAPASSTSTNLFRPKRSVLTIFQRSNTRHRRGAYDECCRKGCSLDEMVGYCGSPSSSFKDGPE